MEDLLILILQAVGEVLLELFAWAPWDCFWSWGDSRDLPPTRNDPYWAAGFLSLMLGAGAGWISIHLFPAVIVRWAWLRIVLLFASPLASGFMASQTARWRRERDQSINPTMHFILGLCFSIGFVWVRFALAHRPG